MPLLEVLERRMLEAVGSGVPSTGNGDDDADGDDDDTPSTGEVLSAQQVFDRIGPSIAFVQTPAGTGSSILIDARHVVTNSHVVWPFEQARIVFPDGTEFLGAAVVGLGPARGHRGRRAAAGRVV